LLEGDDPRKNPENPPPAPFVPENPGPPNPLRNVFVPNPPTIAVNAVPAVAGMYPNEKPPGPPAFDPNEAPPHPHTYASTPMDPAGDVNALDPTVVKDVRVGDSTNESSRVFAFAARICRLAAFRFNAIGIVSGAVGVGANSPNLSPSIPIRFVLAVLCTYRCTGLGPIASGILST
jgi:hypothetical protein